MNMDKKQILKTLGVRILNNKPIYSDLEIVGCINGFFIFPYSYYWVVKGKMPIRYANELYKFRDTLGIRVAGGANKNKPIDWCTSDEYELFYTNAIDRFSLMDVEEWSKELTIKKAELINKDIDSFYVEMYHIDDVKGLKKVVDIIKENNIKTEW